MPDLTNRRLTIADLPPSARLLAEAKVASYSRQPHEALVAGRTYPPIADDETLRHNKAQARAYRMQRFFDGE